MRRVGGFWGAVGGSSLDVAEKGWRNRRRGRLSAARFSRPSGAARFAASAAVYLMGNAAKSEFLSSKCKNEEHSSITKLRNYSITKFANYPITKFDHR
jgi:hypothetical protein